MDYCAGVWGYYDSPVINNIQNRTMHNFLAVNKFTPTHAFYGELGLVMPRYRRWLRFAQLWNRLILVNDNRGSCIGLYVKIPALNVITIPSGASPAAY